MQCICQQYGVRCMIDTVQIHSVYTVLVNNVSILASISINGL